MRARASGVGRGRFPADLVDAIDRTPAGLEGGRLVTGAERWLRRLPAMVRLRHDQCAVAAGAEGLRHSRALVVRVDSGRVEESDRDLHSVAVRAHRLGVPGGRTEQQAAIAAHLDAHVVDALRAGDTVLVVPELEDAVLVHELLCRDACAEDVGPPLGADLEEDILLLRVDVRHAGTREDGAETLPARHAARADAATLQVHGEALELARGAARILEIGQRVAVVVDAVTADLDRGRRAVGELGVPADAGGAQILRAGVLVVAVGGGEAGRAARDRSVAADAGAAGLGGAGVLVVAVGGRGAGRAAGDRGVAADAGVAGVGGAGVLVVAVGGGGAGRAAGDGGVVADAGVAGVGGAGVLVVAVARRRAGRAAGDRGIVADARVAGLGGAGVLVVAVARRGAGRAAGEGGVVADAGAARVSGAGVLVVAVGGGGAGRAAGDGGAGALLAAVADVVEGAGVAVVARRVGRLEGVGRAVHARPCAGLVRVACAGRRAADHVRVGGRVNAPAAPVALIRAAHVAVVGARGAARCRRARARPGLTAVGRRAPAAVVTRGPVGHGWAGARAGLAGVGAGAGVLVVAGRDDRDRRADAHTALAGVAAGAGVAVVAGRRVE